MAKKPKALTDDESVEVVPDLAAKRVVVWTELGEQRRATSEAGTHKAGEEVETEIADHLILHGFAKAVE